jgi:magnesium transporter
MLDIIFRPLKAQTFKSLPDPRPGVWVACHAPSEEELERLVALGLERSMLDDALDPNEVPRTENENGIAYLYTRFPFEHHGETGTTPILFAVTPETVVSLSREHPSFLHACKKNPDLLTTQRTRLFLILVRAMNTSYQTHLLAIQREIQKSKVRLEEVKNKDIVRLVTLENTLNDFVAALVPTLDALRFLLNGKHLALHEKDSDLMEDIEHETNQSLESAKAHLKTIQNIRSAYTALISNDLNTVIKLLTSITVIITIPTVIGSFFGMNVPVPLGSYPHAFAIILSITLFAMGGIAYFFGKRGWF